MILNMSHVSNNVVIVIGPTPPPTYLGMTLHGWILIFGIIVAMVGVTHAIAMEEWLWGTRNWHKHLIKRSFAYRVMLTLQERMK